MGRLNTLLFGLAAGAGLMFFNDPQLGERRRTIARDRINSVRRQSDEAIDRGVRDLKNRARGLQAEMVGRFSGEETHDWVLRERMMSHLGTVARRPGAISIDVREGKAFLTGDILQEEAESVVAALRKVRGVRDIENNLRVHAEAGEIQALRGAENALTGGSEMWSPSSRLLAVSGGSLLWLYGSLRGGIPGFLMKWGGFGLAARGLFNKNLKNLAGMGDGDQGVVDIRKTVTIQAPVEEVYGMWENFENFPRFMSHVKSITNQGGGRSHWVVKGPAGVEVEFDAVMTENVPNELIAWETVADSQVKHRGRVRFTRQNDRTRAQVWMTYVPPAGALGHAVATLFGTDPKTAMDEDLVRLKSLLETGKTTTEGQTVRKEELNG
jgi:uncharacterized membrane protein